MTTFNTDYNKTELLDHELEAVNGGKSGIQRWKELPDSWLTPEQRKIRNAFFGV
jgi:rubredoxin